jgi:transcriptional regulator with XRE-family HTH domain
MLALRAPETPKKVHMQNITVGRAISAIERRRETLKISRAALCRAAGVDPVTYFRVTSGRTKNLQRQTLDALDAALDALAGRPPPPPLAVIAAFHRSAMIELARAQKLDPEAVLAADFSKQNSVNRAWLAAARVRRMAMYVTVTSLAISSSALARAIGVTKQNVGQALAQIEDLRDAETIDRLLDDVTRLLTGR